MLSRMRRRILYAMHIDWRWIKQRPQFLAEELATEHDVQVVHRLIPGFRGPVRGEGSLAISGLLPLPWSWKKFRWATRPVQQCWVGNIARKFRPDIVWLTSPALLEMIPARLMDLPVVYDCMDDALGFAASNTRCELLASLEAELVSRSRLILCSSSRLRLTLADRYGRHIAAKVALVRNGISTAFLSRSPLPEASTSCKKQSSGGRTKIAYFGTIAEWLDFESLATALEHNESVEFHLIGPCDVRKYPKHERLKLHGPVAHQSLPALAANFDAYMMPFQLTPLIEAVDPVKLYEYIAFGKEIISIGYPEVNRFADFVHFYRTRTEFVEFVDKLATGQLHRKNRLEKNQPFLAQNTWRSRTVRISRLLHEI